VPLFIGQAMGHASVGLTIGLGALYTTTADKEGARWYTLLVTTFAIATTGLIATLAGNVTWQATLVMFCAAFFAGILGIYGTVAFNVGFAPAIACAVILGRPGHSEVGLQRMFEFAIGGLWSTTLTLLLWRYNRAKESAEPKAQGPPTQSGANNAQQLDEKEEEQGKQRPDQTFRATMVDALHKLKWAITTRSVDFQHAWRLGFTSALAVALYKHFHLENGYWLTLTTLVIMKPIYEDTRQRALERVGGSFGGGVIAVLLVGLIHNVLVLDVLLVITCLLAYSQLPYSYTWFVAFLTPFVVLMINISSPGNWQIALVRVGNTFLGGAITVIVAMVLRPRDAPTS
jgi:uncharacterized membrane protein YgaE (UPF0421/DUF939 family)